MNQKFLLRLLRCHGSRARNNKLRMLIKKIFKAFKSYKSDSASLTIVGVGPGDPSLLTIAALEAIKKAKVIVFPVSDDNKKSFAAEIVKKYTCLLYTSPSPRDKTVSRMPSSA